MKSRIILVNFICNTYEKKSSQQDRSSKRNYINWSMNAWLNLTQSFFQWSKKKMMEFCKQCCELVKFLETKEYSGTHLTQQKSNYLYYLLILEFFINSENLFLSISWQLCCLNNTYWQMKIADQFFSIFKLYFTDRSQISSDRTSVF